MTIDEMVTTTMKSNNGDSGFDSGRSKNSLYARNISLDSRNRAPKIPITTLV